MPEFTFTAVDQDGHPIEEGDQMDVVLDTLTSRPDFMEAALAVNQGGNKFAYKIFEEDEVRLLYDAGDIDVPPFMTFQKDSVDRYSKMAGPFRLDIVFSAEGKEATLTVFDETRPQDYEYKGHFIQKAITKPPPIP